MSHAEVEAKFSDYSEGELSADEAEAVKGHLASCDTCRRAYEEFLGTVWKVSRLRTDTADAPERFLESVQSRIRARSKGRFFSKRRIWARFPLETVSLITLLVLLAAYIVLVALQPTGLHEVTPTGGNALPR